MDKIDLAIVNCWEPCDLMALPYTPKIGRMVAAVANETGVELSFQELWDRLLSLRDRCEIVCVESESLNDNVEDL